MNNPPLGQAAQTCLYVATLDFDEVPIALDVIVSTPLVSDTLPGIQAEYPSFGMNLFIGGVPRITAQITSDGSNLEGWTYYDGETQYDIGWTLDYCPAEESCFVSETIDLSLYPDATIVGLLGIRYLSYGQVFFSDPGSWSYLDDYIKGIYGTGASATITNPSGSNYVITINNLNYPTTAQPSVRLDLDGLGNIADYTFTKVPC